MCLCLAQIKCQQYWPSAGEATYGSYVVKVLDTSTYAQYTVRTIEYHLVSVRLVAQTPVYMYVRTQIAGQPQAPAAYTLVSVYVYSQQSWMEKWTSEGTLFNCLVVECTVFLLSSSPARWRSPATQRQ